MKSYHKTLVYLLEMLWLTLGVIMQGIAIYRWIVLGFSDFVLPALLGIVAFIMFFIRRNMRLNRSLDD